VQSALTRACEKWSRVRRTTDPDAYVRRMVVNAHVSAWRRSGRRELTVAEVRDTEVGDHAEGIATGDAVWRVCATLPPQQRAAVVLRYYEDLEYAEIAAVLGVTQATARSHVHRALAAMRAELTQEDHDD
jgi:RNA polymerase sigma factor (sigma-70 family)